MGRGERLRSDDNIVLKCARQLLFHRGPSLRRLLSFLRLRLSLLRDSFLTLHPLSCLKVLQLLVLVFLKTGELGLDSLQPQVLLLLLVSFDLLLFYLLTSQELLN